VSNTVKQHTEDQIRHDLLDGRLATKQIALKYDVTMYTVNRLMSDICHNVYRHPVGVYGDMSKTSSYWTEDEMLSSPFYNATNREKITPIREDWKLY